MGLPLRLPWSPGKSCALFHSHEAITTEPRRALLMVSIAETFDTGMGAGAEVKWAARAVGGDEAGLTSCL